MNNVAQLADGPMKLVRKNRHSPRPVKVYYNGGQIGHCKSVKSAITCATQHMLNEGETFNKANITYEDVPVADVERNGNKIATTWKTYYFKIGE